MLHIYPTQGSIYTIKSLGVSLNITVNDCRARYAHRFDAYIVCIKQDDGGGGGLQSIVGG